MTPAPRSDDAAGMVRSGPKHRGRRRPRVERRNEERSRMASNAQFSEIAALVGDPARAGMLHALMDGRALTASELAGAAGVTPQTASGHLARLSAAGLLAVEKQGRH